MAILMKANTGFRLWLFLLLAVTLILLMLSFSSRSVQRVSSRGVLNDLSDLALLGNVSTTESTCKKGVRCKQRAYCGGFFGGDEGTCGFSPNYCGDDCDS